jgi:glycosyltransferase involved in cell wall biosynthesis
MWWAPHAARIASHLGCRSAVILRDGIATIPKAKQYRLSDNDWILPVSSTIGDALRPDPLFRDRVQMLFNSVSVPKGTDSQASDLDLRLRDYPSVKRWLLVIGKVGARKNQADAVKVLRMLMNDGHPDLGLLLAGDVDPAYAPAMNAAISENQVLDRVAMIGNFDGLQALFDRADTVLLPSFREGLPRSLVESITAGKPAFSFPCEGVEDIYGERLTTFVSQESDAGSLYHTIRNAWRDPATTSAAFASVQKEVIAKFSPDAHLRRLKSLLEST